MARPLSANKYEPAVFGVFAMVTTGNRLEMEGRVPVSKGTKGKSSSRRSKPAEQRAYLREQLWPSSSDRIWNRKENQGFTTIPRVLSLVMSLINHLVLKGNPSNVYLGLWLRSFDEGIITIRDEEALAYEAGYFGTRALRTWREHVLSLCELGFIKVMPDGNREVGHVLLVNPLLVCANLRAVQRVPDEWWSAFANRAGEIGASIPSPFA